MLPLSPVAGETVDLLPIDSVDRLEAFVAEAKPLHLGEVAHAAVEVTRPREVENCEPEHRPARKQGDDGEGYTVLHILRNGGYDGK